jgi:hypothetical protein
VQLNLDLVDGLDYNSSDSQCSLPSIFLGCGVTDQGKLLGNVQKDSMSLCLK